MVIFSSGHISPGHYTIYYTWTYFFYRKHWYPGIFSGLSILLSFIKCIYVYLQGLKKGRRDMEKRCVTYRSPDCHTSCRNFTGQMPCLFSAFRITTIPSSSSPIWMTIYIYIYTTYSEANIIQNALSLSRVNVRWIHFNF